MTVEELLVEERRWSKLIGTLDSGSYCESASSEYIAAQRILGAVRQLTSMLLEYERAGHKMPRETP